MLRYTHKVDCQLSILLIIMLLIRSQSFRFVTNRARNLQYLHSTTESSPEIPSNAKVTYTNFDFKILHESKSSKARTTIITTPHGQIETPNFIVCATKAATKGSVTPQQLHDQDCQIILSNTYHLMLTPGNYHFSIITAT